MSIYHARSWYLVFAPTFAPRLQEYVATSENDRQNGTQKPCEDSQWKRKEPSDPEVNCQNDCGDGQDEAQAEDRFAKLPRILRGEQFELVSLSRGDVFAPSQLTSA